MPVTRATSRAQEWATASSQSPQSKSRMASGSNSSLIIEEDADSITEYKTATDESLSELINDVENANNQDRYESTQSELVKLRTEMAELTKIVQQLVHNKNSPPHDNSATSLHTAVHSVSCADGETQVTSIHAVESTTSRSISEVEIEQRIDQLWNNEPKKNDVTKTTQERGTPVLFNGRDHPLSNCYEHSWCASNCKIDFMGKSFKTAENAWAWLYLSRHGKMSDALTAAQSDPFAAKSMCKKVAASAKWTNDQVKHMTALQNAKFECCDGFRAYLIESKGALVENTRDPFWGGIPMYKGENNLGQILMDKRAHVNKISSRTFISNARAAPQTACPEDTQHTVMKKCHKCGESNHSTTSCRHGFRIRCNTCSREGHKAKMCTNTRLTHTHNKEDSRWTAPNNHHASATQEGRMNNNRSSWQPAVHNGNGIPDSRIQQVHNRSQETWDQTMSVPQNYNTLNGQEHQRFNHANFHDKSKAWPSVIRQQPPPYPIGEYYNMYSVLQTTPEATIDAPHQYSNGSGARYNMV